MDGDNKMNDGGTIGTFLTKIDQNRDKEFNQFKIDLQEKMQ